ncbi:YaiI/YqxD family protein [Zongyangia hominis]|uniref:UPF0178 protein H8709_05920 n=1 Tax=Zongyangia hominis TaxID=2763677 RepID=A0A926EDE4_9FIRM|nr:YaiI/YqxD family protein [Zongyangia hominis]MBC8570364.1 YaiI/YqxD family protein [Zongyangia hominis]
MRILIDADGCPVVRLTLQCAGAYGVPVIIFCDTAHEFRDVEAEVVTVSKGADAVDFALVNHARPGDIVITQDYGVAAMALSRGCRALSQNGLVYTSGNIDGLLMSRHLARKVRAAGGRMKNAPKRTKEDDERFLSALRGLLDVAKA